MDFLDSMRKRNVFRNINKLHFHKLALRLYDSSCHFNSDAVIVNLYSRTSHAFVHADLMQCTQTAHVSYDSLRTEYEKEEEKMGFNGRL